MPVGAGEGDRGVRHLGLWRPAGLQALVESRRSNTGSSDPTPGCLDLVKVPMIGTYIFLAFMILLDIWILKKMWHHDSSSNYRIEDDE